LQKLSFQVVEAGAAVTGEGIASDLNIEGDFAAADKLVGVRSAVISIHLPRMRLPSATQMPLPSLSGGGVASVWVGLLRGAVGRASITHHFSIAGHEGYLTVGLYPNGQPGEIFIRMARRAQPSLA
jgi:hypothetical protein